MQRWTLELVLSAMETEVGMASCAADGVDYDDIDADDGAEDNYEDDGHSEDEDNVADSWDVMHSAGGWRPEMCVGTETEMLLEGV